MRNKLLCVLLLVMALVLCACGGDSTQTTGAGNGLVTYEVKVADALGTPCGSGVIARFMQNGAQVAMQVVDENGIAAKELPKGDYTVELLFSDNNASYHYNTDGLTLSAEKTALQIELNMAPAGSTTLYAGGAEHTAYSVSAGCTSVDVKANTRSYFLFTPTVAGTYQFSVTCDKCVVGYYGAPHFVQDVSVAEKVDGNTFTISVSASMIGTSESAGTTTLVIGIDGCADEKCTLCIQRTGDPEKTWEDEPWIIYEAKTAPAKYTLPAGTKLQSFDLTNSAGYNIVYNETDGFYHLDGKDGPLVYVYLGEDSKYLDSYKTILESTSVHKYFYDAAGEFVKRERYVECLTAYINCMDEGTKVYPLTEDLKYIIQSSSEHNGWLDPQSAMYLFKSDDGLPVPGINAEISWLFMCCYAAN